MEAFEMKTEPCPDCKEITIVTVSEPEGRMCRLNVTALRFFRLVEVAPSHVVALPVDVHDSHTATCKVINRKSE